jgi:hypothetical protein
LTFKSLFVDPESRTIAKRLVTALIELQIGQEAGVSTSNDQAYRQIDALSAKLREQCGSFVSPGDIDQYKVSLEGYWGGIGLLHSSFAERAAGIAITFADDHRRKRAFEERRIAGTLTSGATASVKPWSRFIACIPGVADHLACSDKRVRRS